MKKISLFFVVASILYISCKKDNSPKDTPEVKKNNPVTFSVSGFSQSVEGFGRIASGAVARTANQDTLRNYTNYLSLFIFNYSDGHLVKVIRQTSADTSFGIINDSLPTGKYVATMVASRDADSLFYLYFPFNRPVYLYPGYPGTDIFLKRMILDVSGPINQNMVLDRVVSKFKFTIKDKIPNGAKQLVVKLNKYPMGDPIIGINDLPGMINLVAGAMVIPDRELSGYRPFVQQVNDSMIGTINYTKEFYLLTVDTAIATISFTCYGDNNKVISSKTIAPVYFYTSKRTVLSGNLFDSVGAGNGVNVGLGNTSWKDNGPVIEF